MQKIIIIILNKYKYFIVVLRNETKHNRKQKKNQTNYDLIEIWITQRKERTREKRLD